MKYLTNTETRPLLYVEGTGRYMVTMQRYESPLNMNNYQFHINRHKGYLLESFYFWQGCWLSGRKYLHVHACLGKILIFTLGKYMKYLTNTETRPLLYVEGTGRYMVTMQRYESPLNMNNYQFHINRHKGYLLESFYFWQGCWLSGRKYLHVARFISKLFLCASLHSKYRGCSWTFQKWSFFLGHSSQSGIYRLHQEIIYQLET